MTQSPVHNAPYRYPSLDVEQIAHAIRQQRSAKIALAFAGLAAVIALFVATQYLTFVGRPAPGQSPSLIEDTPTAPAR